MPAVKTKKRITKKQKGFVKEFIDHGNATKAALKVYDTDKEESAAQIGWENLRKLEIQKMILDAGEDAQSTVIELNQQRKNLPVALNAAKDILDRAGLRPKEEPPITNTFNTIVYIPERNINENS